MNIQTYVTILTVYCICLLACQPAFKTERETNSFGEVITFTVHPKTGKREGVLERKDAAGHVLERANYRKDSLHGLRVLFYPATTDTLVVETYDNGQFKGAYRVYHENGVLKQTGEFSNGQMNGIWKRYYDTGDLMEEVMMVNGLENGAFREFYSNGNKKAEGNYLEGDAEHGELRLYNEQGKLERIMDCDRGICKTTWRDSTLEMENK